MAEFATGFRHLSNTSSEQKGSIHDDEPAQKLGFKGAFVPGSVVGTSAMPAIMAHFGEAWLHGGWYDMNFVSPVYVRDDVRTVSEAAGEELACRVETREPRLCCAARAGLGNALPWSPAIDSNDVFPEAHIGEPFDERDIDITPELVQPMLDAGADHDAYWREFVHPEHLMPLALHAVDWARVPQTGVQPPGMWARHAIAVRAPMRYGRYRLSEFLANKGVSGRTLFVEFEFRVTDSAGNEFALGRHKCKFIRRS